MKTQRTLLNALIIGALSAFAVQAVANNTNGNREQDEGPWQGGVFNHRDMSVPADPEPPPEVIEPPLIDADGYTNELILMPDYAEGSFIRGAVPSVVVGTRQRPEEILVNAVNARIPTTLTALGNPSDGARLLIRQDRLNEQERLYPSEKTQLKNCIAISCCVTPPSTRQNVLKMRSNTSPELPMCRTT